MYALRRPPPRKKEALPRPVKITKTCGAQRGKVDFSPLNFGRQLQFLLLAEGLFLFTASAAGVRLSLVSKENAKVEPMVSEKVKIF